MTTQKLDGAFLSFRIPLFQWLPDQRFDELISSFEEYRQSADEMAFFSSFIHPVLPLETVRKHMEIVGRRIAAAKKAGYRAGINFLNTLGHVDEYLDDALKGDYTNITGIDGKTAQGSFCPNCDKVRGYLRQAYTHVAQAAPDFIWIDDDIRLDNHGPVSHGCFCDHCLEIFAVECGVKYTRETLLTAFNTGTPEAKKTIRLAWMDHCSASVKRLLQLIEETVHTIKPGTPLGEMSGEHFYERYDFSGNAAILAGENNAPVWWRPGGGFYNDDNMSDIAGAKAIFIGRQISRLPASVVNIQSEIENFPYQPMKKSANANALETAAYIAAGCTGAAYNVLGFYDEPLSEYRPMMQQLTACRPFYDLLVRTLGRSAPRGVFSAWNPDVFSVTSLNSGDWFSGFWNDIGPALFNNPKELYQSGFAAAYSLENAEVTALSGAIVPALSKAEIERILSGGVYLDGQALEQLNALGYGHLTGFKIIEWVDQDCAEILTDDSLNGNDAGTRRDCIQAFWKNPCVHLDPTNANARILARKVKRIATLPEFPLMGVFENALGGRVAVAGYAPWTFLQTSAKNRQLKTLFRWLAKDVLSAYIASYHKSSLWARETVDGNAAAVIINASLDPAEKMVLMLKTPGNKASLSDMGCQRRELTATGRDGVYAQFVLPDLAPWKMVMVVAE